MSLPIILVPQGAEYQAVCNGLKEVADPPIVVPTPAGFAMVDRLKELHQSGQFADQQNILIVGLCGGLQPHYSVGDVVLYRECVSLSFPALPCDRTLTTQLQTKLGSHVPLVTGVTSDRVISSITEKQELSKQADVVDMEGYPALEFLSQVGMSVATLRVVSDDCHHDIPNLANAFSADGSLKALPLALGLLRQPVAGARLIRGSLAGLKVLKTTVKLLFEQ